MRYHATDLRALIALTCLLGFGHVAEAVPPQLQDVRTGTREVKRSPGTPHVPSSVTTAERYSLIFKDGTSTPYNEQWSASDGGTMGYQLTVSSSENQDSGIYCGIYNCTIFWPSVASTRPISGIIRKYSASRIRLDGGWRLSRVGLDTVNKRTVGFGSPNKSVVTVTGDVRGAMLASNTRDSRIKNTVFTSLGTIQATRTINNLLSGPIYVVDKVIHALPQ